MTAFREQARWQAGWCDKLGSPLTAMLCTLLAERLDPASPLGRALDGWPGDPFADVLALRVTGALHALVRQGSAPGLARLYPPAPLPDAEALWAALALVLAAGLVEPWLGSAPQTNEVMRSAVLVPGMLVAASVTGLPLHLLELGTSAGLNLVPDRYRIEAGGVVAGDPGSPVRLRPDWQGPPPPNVALAIVGRKGVDLAPVPPEDAARMLAYIWPDQGERLARTEAALALLAADPPPLVEGDAADFVEAEAWPREGRLTLLFHSIAHQYFGRETKARIGAHMARAGAAAHAGAPLGWLRFEADDPAASAPPTLRLRIWPPAGGGEPDRLLARAHPHGSRVEWLG